MVKWYYPACSGINSRVSLTIRMLPLKCARSCHQFANMFEKSYYNKFINMSIGWFSTNYDYILPVTSLRINDSESNHIIPFIIDDCVKESSILRRNIDEAIIVTTMKKKVLRTAEHADLSFRMFLQNDSCISECQLIKMQFETNGDSHCIPISCSDFPIYIPPTHVNCYDSKIALSLLAAPIIQNRSCQANSYNINIESMLTKEILAKSSLLSDSALQFNPICNISIIPIQYMQDLLDL